MELYVQYILGGLTLGSIYALIALGIVIIYKVGSIVNLAHGQFVVVSALATITIWNATSLHPAAALAIGMVVGGVLGAVSYGAFIAPLWRRSTEAAIIMTIAGFLILESAALVGWGGEPRSLTAAASGPSITILGGHISRQGLLTLVAAAVVAAAFAWCLNGTLIGKSFRACDENPYGAELCGISVWKMGLVAFVLAGMLAGLAGALIVPLTGMTYSQGGTLLLRGLTAAVIGGLSSSAGAFAGAIVLGLLDSVVSGEVPQYREAIVFITLIAFLAARPTGLLGARQ